MAVYIRPMCLAYLSSKDSDPLEFMIDWLQSEGRLLRDQPGSGNERQERVEQQIKESLEKVEQNLNLSDIQEKSGSEGKSE